MADIIEKTEWDQMKSWVNSIYYTTQKSYPTISDVTAGVITGTLFARFYKKEFCNEIAA